MPLTIYIYRLFIILIILVELFQRTQLKARTTNHNRYLLSSLFLHLWEELQSIVMILLAPQTTSSFSTARIMGSLFIRQDPLKIPPS
jgi:hypothetical protein